MISVIGIESTSARMKSSFSVVSMTWLALAKPNSSTSEGRIGLLHLRHGVDDRLHLALGVVLVALDVELHERRVPVLRDLGRREQRVLDVGDLLEGGDLLEHLADDDGEAAVVRGHRLRLDEHALRRRPLEARVREDVLGRRRLAGGRVLLLQRRRAGRRPQEHGRRDERQPAEGGALPVGRAPARRARRSIVSSPFALRLPLKF